MFSPFSRRRRPSSVRCTITCRSSAKSLDNADHVAISIDNYRWRLGLAEGEAKYDDIEKKLARLPSIGVPTITMEGDANGASHPAPDPMRRNLPASMPIG